MHPRPRNYVEACIQFHVPAALPPAKEAPYPECQGRFGRGYEQKNLRYSRDGSVGIALGYGLDDRGSRVRFPAGARNFSLHHRVQSGSGAHPASYPMGTRGSFPWGKAAGA
jgi:hypothetical protein